jgi:hypothetical protein
MTSATASTPLIWGLVLLGSPTVVWAIESGLVGRRGYIRSIDDRLDHDVDELLA